MEDKSSGLPRLWPAHAGLAKDRLYASEQSYKTGVHLFYILLTSVEPTFIITLIDKT